MEDYDKRIHRSNQLLIAASILLFLVTLAQWVNAQNVGINGDGSTPENNTMLDIKSTGNTSAVYGLKVKDSGANDQFVVRSDGNVGIGTSNPSTLLNINQLGDDEAIIVDKGGSTGRGIQVYQNNGSQYGIGIHTDRWGLHIRSGVSDTKAAVRIQNGSGNDTFWLSNDGNLGLGTVAANHPKNKLDIVGSAVIGSFYGGNYFAPTDGLLVEGKVGIGTVSPKGALDVSSTTGGFIVPRMTTVERNALTPVNGMIVYNTTTNQFNFYENGAWVTK